MRAVTDQRPNFPRRIMRSVSELFDILNGRRLRRVDDKFAGLSQDIAGLKAQIDRLSSHVDALDVSRNATLEHLDARVLGLTRRTDVFVTAEARLTFMERCLGISDSAPAPSREDALDTLIDQRLAQLEARLISVLEGPYLDRVVTAARAPDGAGQTDPAHLTGKRRRS